jgi:hypothetical protein
MFQNTKLNIQNRGLPLSNPAVSGVLRGQSFYVKLKAHIKGWVAQYVRLTGLLGNVAKLGSGV